MFRRARHSASALLGLCCVALVAACATTTSPSTSTSASNPAATSSGSGGDIPVGFIGTIQSSAISLPDSGAAVQAHVNQINATGGINGRKIKLTLCDDHYEPTTATECAQAAVQAHDVAVLSTFTAFSAQIIPILQAAKIPLLFAQAAGPGDFTSPISFPRSAAPAGINLALGLALASAGCKKVGAVVTEIPLDYTAVAWLKKGLANSGIPLVQVQTSLTQASYAAPVNQLLSQGVDCITPETVPTAGPLIVAAVAQSGKKIQIGSVTAEFSVQALKALGSAADGMILAGQEYLPTDTQVPAVQQAITGMQKYGTTPLSTTFGIDGWASVTQLQDELKSISGTPTAAAVFAALPNSQSDTGLLASFSFSAPAPYSGYPRVKNWSYLTWKVSNDAPVLTSTAFQTPPASVFSS